MIKTIMVKWFHDNTDESYNKEEVNSIKNEENGYDCKSSW